MPDSKTLLRRDVVGWSLYDFANTIYSMNIVSLYLKRYIVEDLGHDDRYFDIPFAISMLFAALLLPALGAMSDHSTKKKFFLFLFTITCCSSVGLLALVPPGAIMITIILFVVANFSYEAGQPFYNSLLYSVADGRQARFVSGIGVALGYVGSVIGMILVLPFVTDYALGLDLSFITASGKSGAFLPTAVLFALFSIPIFFWVKEVSVNKEKRVGLAQAYREVWEGLRRTDRYPGVRRFLIADYFFEDAATTVIINIGLYCSIVIGLDEGQIQLFLIVSTVFAVFGSFVIGKLAQVWSLKNILNWIVVGWTVCLVMFVFVESMTMIWVLGSVIGILLGGLWTTSRPLLAELVPRNELGRFFGLFSLSGRAAAVIGPLVWTSIVYFFNPERPLGQAAGKVLSIPIDELPKLPYKLAVLSLAIMMLVGLVIFRKVPDTKRVNNE